MPRYSRQARDDFDDGWGTAQHEAEEAAIAAAASMAAAGAGTAAGAGPAHTAATGGAGPATQIIEQPAHSILAANDSPDIPFERSINPYRGCEHGCIYCFARPTHSWLDLSPGLDFETRIVAKTNAAELLRAAFARPGYRPRPINLGSATDAYQPAERRLRITRGVIEVLAECSHPFSLVTKSSGVERDLDLLAPMAARRLFTAYVSVTTLDGDLARRLEPRAAAPHRRLRTIETLARAGVPVGVSVSPLIPFINEPELERILAAAHDAGATAAFSVVLRLPWEVNPLFERWLAEHFPDRAARVLARVRELHGGKVYDSRPGVRMTGAGVWAELIAQRFAKARARLGYRPGGLGALDSTQFRPPSVTAGRSGDGSGAGGGDGSGNGSAEGNGNGSGEARQRSLF